MTVNLCRSVGLRGLHDEVERASVAQPNRGEVSDVTSYDPTQTKIFREHDDRRIDEALTHSTTYVILIA